MARHSHLAMLAPSQTPAHPTALPASNEAALRAQADLHVLLQPQDALETI